MLARVSVRTTLPGAAETWRPGSPLPRERRSSILLASILRCCADHQVSLRDCEHNNQLILLCSIPWFMIGLMVLGSLTVSFPIPWLQRTCCFFNCTVLQFPPRFSVMKEPRRCPRSSAAGRCTRHTLRCATSRTLHLKPGAISCPPCLRNEVVPPAILHQLRRRANVLRNPDRSWLSTARRWPRIAR